MRNETSTLAGSSRLAERVAAAAPGGPQIAGLTAAVTFAENSVNAVPALLDGDVVFTDDSGNFTGGTLTVSGLLAEDRVAIRNQGQGLGQIGIFGSNVTYSGVAIGTVAGGVGGNLVVTFNSTASAVAVDALLQNLTYSNISDEPTATRMLGIEVVNGQGLSSGLQQIAVTVTAESDVPVLTDLGPTLTVFENAVNAAPVLLDGDVSFVAGGYGFDGGKLIVSGLLGEDRVALRNQGADAGQIGVSGASVSYGGIVIGSLSGGGGVTLTVTFNDAATSAAVEAVIENLTYANVSDTPTQSRTLHFNVIDAAGNALVGGFELSSFAANPLASIPKLTNAAPAFVDLDGDGDLDLVVGELFGQLFTYRNDGGSYVALAGAANPFAAIDIGFVSAPAFVDLDGDGDKDLIVGGDGGVVQSFRNDDGVYTRLTGAADPFSSFAFSRSSAPAPADVDQDGDIDILFGTHFGALRFFRNEGGAYVERTGVDNPFAGITVGSYASPAWIDVDGDGDLDLAVGSWASPSQPIRVWRNDSGVFSELAGSANPLKAIVTDGLFLTRPAFVDLDGDGDPDVVVGTSVDGFMAYRNNASYGPSITVNIIAQIEASTLLGLANSVVFAENDVNAAPALLDADVTFIAGSSGFAGGMLTVSGLLAEDRVAVRNEGAGAGQIGVSGSDVTYDGTIIGTLAGGIGGTLTVTLTAAATAEAIDALIQNLTYANVSDAPTPSRMLGLDIADAAGNHLDGGPQSITVNVIPEPEGPRLTDLAASVIFGENAVNAAPALIDGDVAFTDEAGLSGGTLTVSGLLPEDVVAIRNQGLGAGQIGLFGVNVTYGGVAFGTVSGGAGGDLVVTFNSGTSAAAVDALIQNLTYANVSDDPSESRALIIQIIGGTGEASAPQQIVVTVVAEGETAVAAADTAFVAETGTVTIDVLANDLDPDGPFPSVATVAGVSLGFGQSVILASGARVTHNADGTLGYDPNGAFDRLISVATASATGAVNSVGSDSFTYSLNGGSEASVTITIAGRATSGDQLEGNGFDNIIAGTAAADCFILYHGGRDEVAGGAGSDGFYFGAALDVTDRVDGGAGADDQIGLRGNYVIDLGLFDISNIETFALLSGEFADFESAGGPFSYDITTGDYLIGAGQTLVFNANGLRADESFTFNGSAELDGSFTIFGGFGIENLLGSAGNDGFFFGEGRFNTGGAEYDRIDGFDGSDDQLALRGDYSTPIELLSDSIRNIETIALISSSDPLYGGGAGPFAYDIKTHDGNVAAGARLTVNGNGLQADEHLNFDGRAETDGSFFLIGGGCNDNLFAGAQDDILYGGAGSDRLEGGAGSDRFVYLSAADSNEFSTDLLLDFTQGDLIDLSRIDSNGDAGDGDQSFLFIGDAAFSGAAGELRAYDAGLPGARIVEGDLDGDGAADLVILVSVTDVEYILTANDFSL